MRVWTSEHTFDHPWETVAQANWRKYPNPMNPSVEGVDVLRREVVQHRLVSERLIGLRWNIPGWAVVLIGRPSICYGYERSVVDPLNRCLTLKSTNLTFTSKMSVDEELVYSPHPDDPANRTLLRQAAVIKCRGVPLTDYMEGVMSGIISKNAGKGREAMEWVIGKINDEVKELARSAERLTDGLMQHSVDEIAGHAKKLTDGMKVQAAAPPVASADI